MNSDLNKKILSDLTVHMKYAKFIPELNRRETWELSFGFYPGILLGFRSYNEVEKNNHVLYIPLFDICLTVYND